MDAQLHQARSLDIGLFSQLHLDTGELVSAGISTVLGRKALALLLLLLDAGGRVVTKEEILHQVWAPAVVEDNTIQAQIAALRRALGEDRACLRTYAGRGYQLLRQQSSSDTSSKEAPSALRPSNLPMSLPKIFGRADVLARLTEKVVTQRVTTVVGPAGIGKTRLALEVARELVAKHVDGTYVVELAALRTPDSLPQFVSEALGFTAATDSISTLTRALRGKYMLIVLDNCEHLVSHVAELMQALLHSDGATRFLATSREALRIESESVYVLEPLESPPTDFGQNAPLTYGATEMLLERCRQGGLDIDDSDASSLQLLGSIARRLDGIPLAIELAAGRAASLGLQTLAHRLDQKFKLLNRGTRTHVARHRTLEAALDWSFDLLPQAEQKALMRLSVFVAPFSMADACQVISSGDLSEPEVVLAVANLSSKSLVSRRLGHSSRTFRLLEVTREYSASKLDSVGEMVAFRSRHVNFCLKVLREAEMQLRILTSEAWLLKFRPIVDESRAALQWALDNHQDEEALDLAVASIPHWNQMSLYREALRFSERLGNSNLHQIAGPTRMMKLLISSAANSMYGKAHRWGDTPYDDFKVGLDLAKSIGDLDYSLRALWGLASSSVREGYVTRALGYAKEFAELAQNSDDQLDRAAADRQLGFAYYASSELDLAERHLFAALRQIPAEPPVARAGRFGLDVSSVTSLLLAQVKVLKGEFALAEEFADRSVEHAYRAGHVHTLLASIPFAKCMVALTIGQFNDAHEWLEKLKFMAVGDFSDTAKAPIACVEGTLALREGRLEDAIRIFESPFSLQSPVGFLPVYFTPLTAYLGEAKSLCGRAEEGLTDVEIWLQPSMARERTIYRPELRRIKGDILLRTSRLNAMELASEEYRAALEEARLHGSRLFELRAAISFSTLLADQGRQADGRAMLSEARSRFGASENSIDLRSADALLA